MRYVQAAMSSTQETPHMHTHTHPCNHAHLQPITKEYSFAPSTSGHPPRYERVQLTTNKKERKKTYPLISGRQSPPFDDSAWWYELATFERPTRVFCSFWTWGRVLSPPCSMYKRAPRTTLSQTCKCQITYNLCVLGAAVCTQKPHIKLHGALGFHLAKGRLFFLR